MRALLLAALLLSPSCGSDATTGTTQATASGPVTYKGNCICGSTSVSGPPLTIPMEGSSCDYIQTKCLADCGGNINYLESCTQK
jgi:hypothetical protein